MVDGVPAAHQSVIQQTIPAPSSDVLPSVALQHTQSFCEPNAFDGSSAWPQLLGQRAMPSERLPPWRAAAIDEPATLLFVNQRAVRQPAKLANTPRAQLVRPAVDHPPHARSLCLWSSRHSPTLRHALFASGPYLSRLTAVELGLPASVLASASDADDYLRRVPMRAAQLSDQAIVDLSCQDDVPSLLPTLPSRGLVSAVGTDGRLTVLQVAEQDEPRRLLIDFEAESPTHMLVASASFANRYAAVPSLHVCRRDGALESMTVDPIAISLRSVRIARLPRDEKALFAAPTVLATCAAVCSASTVYSVDWRVPAAVVGEYESRLVRRWPRRPEEGAAARADRMPHTVTALAAAPVPYLFATALANDTGAFACVELWDERNRVVPVDRWRWPTGFESLGARTQHWKSGRTAQRGRQVEALGSAPRQLAFVLNERAARLDLVAVDGTSTRMVALHATLARGAAPVVSPDVQRVPTFWDTLRAQPPYATSECSSTLDSRVIKVRRDGVARERAPLLRGVALYFPDAYNDTVSCVQVTSDGDLYRTVLTRVVDSAPPPSSQTALLAPAVAARLHQVRVTRDLDRQLPQERHLFWRPSSVAVDTSVLVSDVAAQEVSKKAVWRCAFATLKEQTSCSVEELLHGIDCSAADLVAALEPLVAVGRVCKLQPTPVADGDAELARLQTVYYLPLQRLSRSAQALAAARAAAAERAKAAAEAAAAAAAELAQSQQRTVEDVESGAILSVVSQMSQPYMGDEEQTLQERLDARMQAARQLVEQRQERGVKRLPSSEALDAMVLEWATAFGVEVAEAEEVEAKEARVKRQRAKRRAQQ